jgi:hypothetical protein
VGKMEIYLQVLKLGTAELDKYYQRSKESHLHVFYMAVLGSEKYFSKHNAMLNSSTTTFSVALNEQINEVTISKTLKMLFCPICDIYDCGIHTDDLNTAGHSYNYVHPNNKHSHSQMVGSALELLHEYLSIKSGNS